MTPPNLRWLISVQDCPLCRCNFPLLRGAKPLRKV